MDRKHQFKHKSATAKSIREKRRQERQEQRKKRRDAALKGKRMRQNTVDTEDDDFSEEQVIEIVQTLMSTTEGRTEVLKSLRRALSLGSALIEAFLSVDGSLKHLVDLLDDATDVEKVETAWCLNNISAGTDTQARTVIDVAGDALIKGLSSGNVPLEDQCAWAIGNLAGGSIQCRDLLRSKGAIAPLINLLLSPIPQVVHCAAFALSNLARDKETTRPHLTSNVTMRHLTSNGLIKYIGVQLDPRLAVTLLTDAGVLPHLASLLVYDKDRHDILAEVCWVLTYLTACGVHEKKVLEAGILDRLITLLIDMSGSEDDDVQVWTPLLRCLGNVICSGLEETGGETCSKRELFPILSKLLQSDHQHIRKECIWVLSNITALPQACKELIESELITSIINLLSSTFDIKKEAAYTLCNVAANGSDFCVALLKKDALKLIVPLLKSSDVDTVHYALSFAEMMLHESPDAVKIFLDSGGLEGLETLEYNNNDMLREQADNILDVYFYKEDKQEEAEDLSNAQEKVPVDSAKSD